MSNAYITLQDYQIFLEACNRLVKEVNGFSQFSVKDETTKNLKTQMSFFEQGFKQWMAKYFSQPSSLTLDQFADLVKRTKSTHMFAYYLYYVVLYLTQLIAIVNSGNYKIVQGKIFVHLEKTKSETLEIPKIPKIPDDPIQLVIGLWDMAINQNVDIGESSSQENAMKRNQWTSEIETLENQLKQSKTDYDELNQSIKTAGLKMDALKAALGEVTKINNEIAELQKKINDNKTKLNNLQQSEKEFKSAQKKKILGQYGNDIENFGNALKLKFGDNFFNIIRALGDVCINNKMNVASMVNISQLISKPTMEEYALDIIFDVARLIIDWDEISKVESILFRFGLLTEEKRDKHGLAFISCMVSYFFTGKSVCQEAISLAGFNQPFLNTTTTTTSTPSVKNPPKEETFTSSDDY